MNEYLKQIFGCLGQVETARLGFLTVAMLSLPLAAEVTVKIAPGAADATGDFLAAVEKTRRAGGGTIEFARGEYVFSTDSATPLSFKISNHNQTDPHKVALPLVGLTNVTVRADGAVFLVDGAAIGIAVLDCENVKLEGFALDWTRPFISDAVIESTEGGKTRVSVDPVKFPHVYSNGCFWATGRDWTLPVRYLVVADGKDHALVPGTDDYLWKGAPMEKTGPSSYLMDFDFRAKGADVKPGDVIAFRSPLRTCPGVVVYRSKDTELVDVSIHSSWGMGVICQFSENFCWRGTGRPDDRRAGVFPRAGRFYSANADASHFSNCRGTIREENLLFEGMMDDAINVHATSVKITEIVSPKEIRCHFMHGDAYDFELLRPGDRVRFIRSATTENGPSMKITGFRLEGPENKDMLITLRYPLPEGFGVGDSIENAESMPNVVFRGNTVARNRARGALFTTTGDILVESNLFERVSGAAILCSGDAFQWYESGAVRNCIIRGNVFRNCNTSYFQFCDGIISFYPIVRELEKQRKPYHRGIAILDNVFETFRTPLLYARSVENLVFSGNRTVYNEDFKWMKPYPGEIVTEKCRNVKCDKSGTDPMIWGVLLHLGSNMWWDMPRDAEDPVDRNWTDCLKDYLECDEQVWREATDRMAKGGLNLLIVDIGDGIVFPSHPEIAIKGSWSPEKLKAELARLRGMGIEPVPKLNFSAGHDIWMKEYSRKVSTPEYYRFCADVIRDVFEIFGKPRFFHIGFDEESDHPFHSFIVIRRGDLWWHDLGFLVSEIEKRGARAWIWSDAVWDNKKQYLSRMSPNVLQSNWYYYDSFDIAKMKAEKVSHAVEPEAYLWLEEHGFDQVPTGSNWDNPTNMMNTVKFCRDRIAPCRLKGFLQTPWKRTVPEARQHIFESIDQLVEAKKLWEEKH